MNKQEGKELRALADIIKGDVRYHRLNRFTSCLLKIADASDPQPDEGGDPKKTELKAPKIED